MARNCRSTAGRLTGIADLYATYAYTYDAAGRVLTTDDTGTAPDLAVVLTDAYDAAGLRTSLDTTVNGDADLTDAYGYDDAGRLTEIEQSAGAGSTAP